MRIHRAVGGAGAAAATIVAAWAGLAFACTPLPEVYSVVPESAPSRSTVTVKGNGVRSGAPVEIRWNGVKGSVLAVVTATNGDFSAQVQVPDVSPGVYTLVAVTADASVGRSTFEVTGSSASSALPSRVLPDLSAHPSPAADTEPAGSSRAGLVMLSVGVAVLFAGSAAVATRRRRVHAGGDGSSGR